MAETVYTMEEAALAAAHQATEAVSELIRFAREGEWKPGIPCERKNHD